MHLDVLDLRHFYYRTALGRTAQGAIRDQVLSIWPAAERQTVAGFGFAVPLLRPYLASAERVMALMPAPQGVMPWPPGEPNTAALVQEILWPVETDSVDRLLVMHGLETSENPGSLLDECYRALAPGGGRALFIVPNRGGLWSRSDATPFGFGRPYSLGQLEALLKSHGLLPQQHKAALFQPPSSTAFWTKTAGFWERVGRKVSRRLAGGVLIVEVSKQVPAPTKRGLGHAIRKPLTVLDGITKPAPKPA